MGRDQSKQKGQGILDAPQDYRDDGGPRNIFRVGLPYVMARLTLYESAISGRRHAIVPGYRAHWWISHPDGQITHNDGPLDLVDSEQVAPGESAQIRIHPIAPQFWQDLELGSRLELWEGRVIGQAIVTATLVQPSRS